MRTLAHVWNSRWLMKSIPIQRLLTHQAHMCGVRFALYGTLSVPPVMVFSPGWAMPLVAAWARAMAVRALGARAAEVVRLRWRISEQAPLGREAYVQAVDGSADGLLRAVFLWRAAQDALGYNADTPGKAATTVDFGDIVQWCRQEQSLGGLLLRLQDEAQQCSPQEAARLWDRFVREQERVLFGDDDEADAARSSVQDALQSLAK